MRMPKMVEPSTRNSLARSAGNSIRASQNHTSAKQDFEIDGCQRECRRLWGRGPWRKLVYCYNCCSQDYTTTMQCVGYAR